MVNLFQILPPDGVLLHLKAGSIESAVRQMSDFLGDFTGLRPPDIHERLMARTQMGVSLSGGAILPHARMAGLQQVIACFGRPLAPIPVANEEPITMIFTLLAPENADAEHLKTLASIAGILRDPALRQRLLTGKRDDVYRVLAGAK
jgi:PTS system nitrogen regulatory IIA component